MIIVDLQELEERAQTAAASADSVMMEPEALLLIISEIRRMKSLLGEQHGHLAGVQGELQQLRTELANALTRQRAQPPATPQKKTKMLKMRVVKDDKDTGNTQS